MMYLRDINWSDTHINRAGIIPYYETKGVVFIGLGINQNNTTITTIGGTYESKDFDLLDTAIREYNEEVGNNLPNIGFEDIIGCLALKSERSIHILLKIENIPKNFVATTEFVKLLWVTPKQLKIMSENNLLTLSHKNTRAFPFTVALRECTNQIIDFFESKKFYCDLSRNTKPERSQKQQIIKPIEKTISEDIDQLKKDILKPFKIYHFGLVITENKFGIILNDGRVYIISTDFLKEAITIVNSVQVFKCLACNSDVLTLKNKFGFKMEKLYALERCMTKNTDENPKAQEECTKLKLEFLEKLKQIRDSSNEQNTKIIQELNLINEYESKSYEIHHGYGLKYIANARLNFFEKLNTINIDIISKGSYVFKQHLKEWESKVLVRTNMYEYSRAYSSLCLKN